mmetsp:Transcript_34832/g.76792  ORF Transcript_34832/g.76792 Transcript_34832/m.76792 type:complete len:211 (-) Transcript_34832:1905-2537(-)
MSVSRHWEPRTSILVATCSVPSSYMGPPPAATALTSHERCCAICWGVRGGATFAPAAWGAAGAPKTSLLKGSSPNRSCEEEGGAGAAPKPPPKGSWLPAVGVPASFMSRPSRSSSSAYCWFCSAWSSAFSWCRRPPSSCGAATSSNAPSCVSSRMCMSVMNFSMKNSMAVASLCASLLRKMYSMRRLKDESANTFTSRASLPDWESKDHL